MKLLETHGTKFRRAETRGVSCEASAKINRISQIGRKMAWARPRNAPHTPPQ